MKQKLSEDITIDIDADIVKQYQKLIADAGLSPDKLSLKYCLRDITSEAKKIHRRLGDIYSHRSFSSHFGSLKNLRQFYLTHIEFLKTRNSLTLDKLKVDSFAWKDFIVWVKTEMDFILCPDDKQFKALERDKEWHQDRKDREKKKAQMQYEQELYDAI